jgi:hypothetical protein
VASASGFDPARLPAALRAPEIVEGCTFAPEEVARAHSFGEGQISGPFGPRFVGYGKAPKAPLWRYIAEWTAVLFVGSLLVMAVL